MFLATCLPSYVACGEGGEWSLEQGFIKTLTHTRIPLYDVRHATNFVLWQCFLIALCENMFFFNDYSEGHDLAAAGFSVTLWSSL